MREVRDERRDKLARLIVKELVERPGVTQFVIKFPQGRVCLFVVRNSRGVHVAALCPPVVRSDVERALARARMVFAC